APLELPTKPFMLGTHRVKRRRPRAISTDPPRHQPPRRDRGWMGQHRERQQRLHPNAPLDSTPIEGSRVVADRHEGADGDEH
ncbi:MAG: hypothetical protein KY433_05975, partial [Actinobacteria bacterium]|nr:hypothetical protein [Actinomycetota bacterium]